MFIDDAHILRASSSTVCAWTSKRPAIARIACGSVIKRVAMLAFSLILSDLFSVVVSDGSIGYALPHRRAAYMKLVPLGRCFGQPSGPDTVRARPQRLNPISPAAAALATSVAA